MKKITQKEKRKLNSGHSAFSRIYRIQNHFFPNLPKWFNSMKDPRHSSYIEYDQSVFINEMLLKCHTGISSMRSMNETFNTDKAIRNLAVLSDSPDLNEKADWQTINNYLERLESCELEKVRYDMIRALIRTREFSRFTVNGAYCVVIDGTDIAHFNKKHCEHDLVVKKIDKETGEERYEYYHKALEAKILLGPGLVISICTEFIENEKEDVSKQDCELNAGYRLLDKLKKAFPKMKFIILGDALFCAETFMARVRSKKWDYIFRVKAGRQSKLMGDFEDLLNHTANNKVLNICEGETGISFYENHVEQITDKEQICNMVRYVRTDTEKSTTFDWVTNIEIDQSNLGEITASGRNRWRIENEGFNVQKNGIYYLEHLCSRNWNAMKNHYLIIQIAHMIMQLYLAFDKIIRALGKGYKQASHDLLMSVVSGVITDADLAYARKKTALHLQCLLVN